MNRRDFVKTVAGSMPLTFLLNADPKDDTGKYQIECRIQPKDKELEEIYHVDFWINDSNKYDNIEDAVQQVFEHSKQWKYDLVESKYDIIRWDQSKGYLHCGSYKFYEAKNLYEGWHSPYTNTLYLEDRSI